MFVYKCHLSQGIPRIHLTRNRFGLQRNYRKKLERLQAQNRYPMPRSKFRFPRRVRMDSATVAMAAARKATDMALSNAVRTAIWTDMAPSCANVVATPAATRKGMNLGEPFGVLYQSEVAPRNPAPLHASAIHAISTTLATSPWHSEHIPTSNRSPDLTARVKLVMVTP
jgi:hypothetical protein